jgi:hypothetical protein
LHRLLKGSVLCPVTSEVDPSAPRPYQLVIRCGNFILASSSQGHERSGYRGAVQASMLKPDRGLRTRPRHAAPDTSRRDQVIAGCVFGGLFFVYLAVSRHTFVAYDAASMVAVGTNLTNHFTLNTVGAFDDYLHLSTPYSPYGIGVSLLVVPVYALSKLAGHEMLLLSLINPLLTAVAGVVVFAIGRELRWLRTMSVLAALHCPLGVGHFALEGRMAVGLSRDRSHLSRGHPIPF